ncbi:hypothetical protein GJ744_004429 [Endocarpon pusillum]|uniref:Ribophorin II C-terminal domain-containing protein n=1 Tax=Endocarpon pusillum TaxID=364733 RepID=A0A8H7E8A4_9EURO|nr:hypothetical protein GJ744_004429 [Endocarpon pusillum]
MVYLWSLLPTLLAVSNLALCRASSWHFSDATVSVQGKGAGVGGGFKEKFVEHKPLSAPVTLGASDSLKVVLTIQDGKMAKRPHQAFLLLKDTDAGLDISYPFSIKESGKAKVDLTQKDLPSQFLTSSKPVEAHLVLGSFGSSQGYNDRIFSLNIATDRNGPIPTSGKPLRYGKLPEIHHIFKPNPSSPNIVFSLLFTGAVLSTLPAIVGVWLYLGANVNHLSKAFQSAPISHTIFYGSIIGIEAIFLLYYTSWNLFKTLPVLFAAGAVTFLSGSRALSEVQERRLAGER